MPEPENIELRSDEVQEILGTPPKWIIRRGIGIILGVIVVLLAGSYFYKYPDMIMARVTIISENPPVTIVARANGKLDTLLVSDKQRVCAGEVLCVIENPANYRQMIKLIEELDSLKHFLNSKEEISQIKLTGNYNLGEFQSFYSSFVARLKEFETYLNANPVNQRIKSLERQIADYNVYYKRLGSQIEALREDYSLTEKQFRRDSLLFTKSVFSESDFERSKAMLLKQKYSYLSALSNHSNVKITMNQLIAQIQELEISTEETGQKLVSGITERYENLVTQLKLWEQTYLIKTPINGTVTFNTFWSENQNITSGSAVFTIVPSGEFKIIGKAIIPVTGAGKVEIGQKVNIKLDNFPHMEFGLLEAKVSEISLVPVTTENGSFYTANISLNNNLTTNYKKTLPFNQEMQGNAEIITKDRRLIQRFIEPLTAIFKEKL